MNFGVYRFESGKKPEPFAWFATEEKAEAECKRLNTRWQTCAFCVCGIDDI